MNVLIQEFMEFYTNLSEEQSSKLLDIVLSLFKIITNDEEETNGETEGEELFDITEGIWSLEEIVED